MPVSRAGGRGWSRLLSSGSRQEPGIPQVCLCLPISASPHRTPCWRNGEPRSEAGFASVPGNPPVTPPLRAPVVATPIPLLSPRCRMMPFQGLGTGCAVPNTHSLQVTPPPPPAKTLSPSTLSCGCHREVAGGLAARLGVWPVIHLGDGDVGKASVLCPHTHVRGPCLLVLSPCASVLSNSASGTAE